MDWSELIKKQAPGINEYTCAYAAKLAQALENRGVFDLGATIICSTSNIIFSLSPHTIIHIQCNTINPYHFYSNGVVTLNQTLDEILELIDTNWSNIFGVKRS